MNLTGRCLILALTAALTVTSCSTQPSRASVQVESLTFHTTVATTRQQQLEGLSNTDVLAPGTGMLFPFRSHRSREVWMKDTTIALDVAWVSQDRILSTTTLQPCPPTGHCPRHRSPDAVDALLEVPAGSLRGIAEGAPVTITYINGEHTSP